MGVKISLDGKLYYCAAGIGGVPTWTEIKIVRDMTVTISKGEADVSSRGGGGWKAVVGTMKELVIDFEIVYDPEVAAVAALLDAFLNGTALGLAAMNGDIETAGTQGMWADCAILKFDEKEPLEGAVTIGITAKSTYSANPPQWKTI